MMYMDDACIKPLMHLQRMSCTVVVAWSVFMDVAKCESNMECMCKHEPAKYPNCASQHIS